MSIYQEKGYENRMDYLISLSEEMDIPLDIVLQVATTLGKTEDFDGLVTTLEDYQE